MYGKFFKEGYHLMGRWRLTYAPAFTRSLGYRYMMFVDDDAIVMKPIDSNLVEVLDAKGVALAHRNMFMVDIPEPLSGIAELARYWMVTRNVTVPFGPFFQHLQPSSIEGLSSIGWDRHIFQTSFMVLNLDFWYEEPVQDFIDLVLSTGGDLTQRWLEQGVVNIVRLLFLRDEQVLVIPQTDVLHDKVADPRIFKLLHCDFVNSQTSIVSAVLGTSEEGGVRQKLQTEAQTEESNLGKIEFLIVWEHYDVKPVATEKLKELFLFHWLYNRTSCGTDTAFLNNYTQYMDEAENQNLRIYWWWHEFAVDNKLNVILLQGKETADGSGFELNVSGDEGVDGGSKEDCRAICRQQLVQYVEFYCAYTGIHQGRPMAEYCANIKQAVLHAYDSQ